ncbi:MAG: hypothetical protein PHO90_01045 [Candidatus Pacebacteria bacterium]|nr:hypothetical protein [Candidatus Paceibacterota bacterium]
MPNNIELELRAEITLKKFKAILEKLRKRKKFIKTDRLTVMFLGTIGNHDYDIRVRTGRGEDAEVVFKKGAYHKHDRVEVSAKINKKQFIDFVRIFCLFEFKSKITIRSNYLFDMGDDIFLTLVNAGPIAYVEIEKMSNKRNLNDNKKKIINIFNELDMVPLESQDFNDLCDRLSVFSDKPFNGKSKDFVNLKKLLTIY